METIRTKDHFQLIIQILNKYGFDDKALEIVPDPYLWAVKNGYGNTKVGMIGYSVWDNSNSKVVLKEEITSMDIEDTLQRVCMPLDRGRRYFLSTQENFVTHLTLHEIGHIVNNWSQLHEEEADQFAFREMGFVPKESGF